MAERDVRIGIKVDGAEKAAADAREVQTGMQGLGTTAETANTALDAAGDSAGRSGASRELELLDKSADQAAAELRDVAGAADEASAGQRRLRSSTRTADKAFDSMGKTQTETTNTSRRMGGAIQGVGYQVGDMAVQVAAGQSALIAFTQQGSQLLGVFGPGGAIAGAALAVGGAIAGAMVRGRDEMGETGDAADDLEERLEDVAEKLKEQNEARGEQEFDKYLQGLRDETESLGEQNRELQRNVELREAKRRAGMSRLRAESELRIDEIQNNPELTEEEKARQVADERRRVARAEFETQQAGIRDEVESQAGTVENVEEELGETRGEAETLRARREALKAERKELQGILEAERLREKSAEAYRKQVEEITKSSHWFFADNKGEDIVRTLSARTPEERAEIREGLSRDGFGAAAVQGLLGDIPGALKTLDPGNQELNRDEFDKLVKAIDRLDDLERNRPEVAGAQDRLQEIGEGGEDGGGELGALDEELGDVEKRLAELSETARKEREKLESTRETAEVELSANRDVFQSNSQLAERRAQRNVEQAAAERKRREREAEVAEMEGRVETGQETLDDRAEALSREIREAVELGRSNNQDPEVLRNLETVRRNLADGTSGEEMQRLTRELVDLFQQTESEAIRGFAETAASLRDQGGRISSIVDEIAAMRREMRNLRNAQGRQAKKR